MSNENKTGQQSGRKVLRSQKQPGPKKAKPQTPAAPTPKPTVTETVTLASGERRKVKIEASNDKEWSDLLALAEGACALSLDQKDAPTGQSQPLPRSGLPTRTTGGRIASMTAR